MANVLNKTADPADYRTSVNTPDFPPADWFIDPDVSAVAAVPTKYWQRPLADPVQEMTQGEKDAIDAAELVAAVDGEMQEVLDLVNGLIRAQRIRDNTLRTQINDVANAVKSNAVKPVGMPTDLADITPSGNRTFIRSKVEDIQQGTAE